MQGMQLGKHFLPGKIRYGKYEILFVPRVVPVLRGGTCIRHHEPFPIPNPNPWPTHMNMNVVRENSAKKIILKKTPITIYFILYLVPGAYLEYTRACCTRVCTVLAFFVHDVLRALGIVYTNADYSAIQCPFVV